MTTHTGSIVVVGGGIIGIASAWYLRNAGFEVTLIDKGRVGDACSRGNCGYVCPSHILPLTVPGAIATGIKSLLSPSAPFRIKPQLRASLIAWMWQFARRCNQSDMINAGHHLQAIINSSADEYRRLFAETALDAGWHDTGMLFLFSTRHGFDDFSRTNDLLAEEFGLAAQHVAGSDLQDLEPATRPDLAGGWYYESDSLLRPEALAQSWAAMARGAGVEIIENC